MWPFKTKKEKEEELCYRTNLLFTQLALADELQKIELNKLRLKSINIELEKHNTERALKIEAYFNKFRMDYFSSMMLKSQKPPYSEIKPLLRSRFNGSEDQFDQYFFKAVVFLDQGMV